MCIDYKCNLFLTENKSKVSYGSNSGWTNLSCFSSGSCGDSPSLKHISELVNFKTHLGTYWYICVLNVCDNLDTTALSKAVQDECNSEFKWAEI